jgi:NAD(P)-dependent dehydrogenase (short-subunit alcohol dehydrogenase family)
MSASKNKVWFITGTSKGFGRIWAEAALQRGDQVIATARDKSTLQPLVQKYGEAVLALSLDVNSRQATVDAVAQGVAKFGRIDVAIANAGYGHFGYVEEITEAEARAQLETNVLGSLWTIQAVLPVMRQQKSGHILQLSSIGGILAFPGLGIYHASKWAMEGLCDSLSQEVSSLGIKVTLVEPTGYSTDWGGPSAKASKQMDAYAAARKAREGASGNFVPGKPEATAEAILTLVDSPEPPLRLMLGAGTVGMAEHFYGQRLKTWKDWESVSTKAHGAWRPSEAEL